MIKNHSESARFDIESKRGKNLASSKALRTVLAILAIQGAASCRILPDPEVEYIGDEDAEHYVVLAGDSIMRGGEYGSINPKENTENAYITGQLQSMGFRTNRAIYSGSRIEDLYYEGNPFPGWPEIPTETSDMDDTELISVTGLGTNDIRKMQDQYGGFNQDSFDAMTTDYNQYLLDTGADCNVYIGTSGVDPTPDVGVNWGISTIGVEFNEFLSSKANTEGDIYIDWAAEVGEHPEYLDPDDMVHLSQSGIAAQGSLIVAAVVECRNIIEAEDLLEG